MSAAAKKLQQDREATDLQNHRERLVWLAAERPCWSCGELVDSHTRHVLMLQSKEALKINPPSQGQKP